MLIKSWGNSWTDSEIQLLKNFSGSSEELAQKLGRTSKAVRSKRYQLGRLKTVWHDWTNEEIKKLRNAKEKGKPFRLAYRELVQYCAKKGVKPPVPATARKMYGEIEVLQEYYSPTDLAELLGVSSRKILAWIRRYSEVLKPVEYGDHYWVEIKNFRSFCREYPGEVASCFSEKASICWLLTALLVK